MRKKRKLMWQIYPSYLIIIISALLAVALYASNSIKQFHLQQIREQLEAHAWHFSTLIEGKVVAEYSQEVDSLCKIVGEQLANRFTVILPSGQVIGDSYEDPSRMDNHANRPEIQQALSENVGTSKRYSYTIEQEMLYVAVPVRKQDDIIGVIRASMPVTAVKQSLSLIYDKIMLAGIIIVILAAIVSLIVSRRIGKPLEEIRQGALRFAHGNLTHRIQVPESEEIGILAETMNQMASQLAERIQTVTKQRNELEAVLANMVEAVIILDRDERIVRCNQTAARLFNVNPEAIGQRSIQETIRNPDIQRFVKKTFEHGGPVEDVLRLHSEQERFLYVHGTSLYETEENVAEILLVFHDITRLKQLENMRREFVANVSHELRTPITSIVGFIETLQDGAINDHENASKFLTIVERNANRLNSIINDLLTLSRIEQEKEEEQILLTKECIKDVLEAAVMICQKRASERQITIHLQCDDALQANINAALLEQAVVNLLDNAIKYSDPGNYVNLSARQQGQEVLISVEDFGCGISEEHLPRLFERFYRVDKARSRKLGGTGLGLAIVKHIANAHNGRATVESTPGKGSTFSIIIPVH